MLALQINDPEIEDIFAKQFKSNRDDFIEFIAKNLEQFKDKKTLKYTKKDPSKHIQTLDYKDDNEDLSDVNPYNQIKDSAKYIHNLRRKNSDIS